MRSARRTLAALVVAAAMTLTVGASGQAAVTAKAPTRATTWHLIDNHQRSCWVSTRGGTSYYGIWISGTWKRKVNVGADGLPAGGSFYTSYAPIAPGSSNGVGSLAYVAVVLPVGTPVGTYTSSLWASDGRTKQAVPITLVVQATSCSHY
jgi:hypothetical protein